MAVASLAHWPRFVQRFCPFPGVRGVCVGHLVPLFKKGFFPRVVRWPRVSAGEFSWVCLYPGRALLPRTHGQLSPAAEGAALLPPYRPGCRPPHGKARTEARLGQTVSSTCEIRAYGLLFSFLTKMETGEYDEILVLIPCFSLPDIL